MTEDRREERHSLRAQVDLVIAIVASIVFVVSFLVFVNEALTRRHGADQLVIACANEPARHACLEDVAALRTAVAAEDMVDLGVFQFLAGLAGLVLVALTLRATRDAVREANGATAAARDAVRVSEISADRQIRAYVAVDGVTAKWASPTELMVCVVIKNFGQTPAYEVEAYVMGHIDEFPIANPHERGPAPERFLSSIPLVPTASQPLYAKLDITGQVRDGVRDGYMAGYVYGRVTYRDAFGKTRTTLFAVRGTERTLLINGDLGFCLEGNSAD